MFGESIARAVGTFSDRLRVGPLRLRCFARVCLGIVLAGTSLAPRGRAQEPQEFPYQRWFPTEVVPRSNTEALTRDLRDYSRLLKKGSPSDREIKRSELMRDIPRLLPPVLTEFQGGNLVEQLPLGLVFLQVHEPAATQLFMDVLLSTGKGQRGLMALALGRGGRTDAHRALERLVESSRPDDRLRAILAAGRLGAEQASPWLEARMRQNPLTRELESLVLAMGMTGSAVHIPTLVEQSKSSQDSVRRAAAAALSLLAQAHPAAQNRLLKTAEDEDPLVRLLSLRGLAVRGPVAGLLARLPARPGNLSADEEAEWVLCELILGGAQDGFGNRFLQSPRPQVRAAVAGAAFAVRGSAALRTVRGMLADPHQDVLLVALLASMGLPPEASGISGLTGFLDHSDESIREAALLSEVYARGIHARSFLEASRSNDLKDDVRRKSRELLTLLDLWPDAARDIAWARLQVLLDGTGFAASFNAHRSVNELMRQVLGIAQTGLFRGRRIPVPGSGGEVAPRRFNPDEEDLRRHLELYPYEDRRLWTEFLRPARGQ